MQWLMKAPRNNRTARHAGFSLVSVLVAIAMMSLSALALNSLFANTFNAVRHAEMQADLIEIRSFLLARTSCPTTMTAATVSACKTTNKWIAIRKNVTSSASNVLIEDDADGTKIGRYSVRARCVACSTCSNNRKIVVEYAMLNDKGGFSKNPLTGKKVDWADMYEGVPFACPVP